MTPTKPSKKLNRHKPAKISNIPATTLLNSMANASRRRAREREERTRAERAAKEERAHRKRIEQAAVSASRLHARIDRMEAYPSALAARQLRDIALDVKKPAEVRARAGAIALRWAQDASPRTPTRKRRKKDKADASK